MRLQSRGKPYYRAIEPGLHLGYRKPKGRRGQAVAGAWVCRLYKGDQSYKVERLGVADDFSDADGVAILSWKQAQDVARAKLTGQTKEVLSGPLTVRQAVESYIEFLERSRKSAGDARYRAKAAIYGELGDIEASSLTTKRIRDWLDGIANSPVRLRTRKGEPQKHRDASDDPEAIRRRRSTANRTLTVLKAALKRQWREGHIASDAAWRRVEPFKGVDAARVRYLTVAEAKRLINASDADFRPLVQAALLTGCRYGELIRLEVADFNPDSETVAIRVSKSGKARHVELTEEGAVFFRQHCAGRAGSEVMFQKADGSPWGKSHQNRPMIDANTRAKISPPIGFHGLRHTWASLAVMNAVPLLVVAKNLGHADTRMVEKHYGHLAPSYIREAIRAGAPKFGVQPASKVLEIRS
jgi:integrase